MTEQGTIRGTGRIGDHPAAAPVAFVTFLALGCAYILTAKLWGVRPGFVTFVPVACMAAYAAAMLFLDGLRLRDDQAGDNLYYMGFLYTLTSLGVSLYQFTSSSSGEGIVQNFGIAIASTIAGVAGRVLFNQMRRDPAEVERQARMELAESSRRVRRELDATVVEMAFFRRQMTQMLQEGLHETRERFGAAWEGVHEGLVKATEGTVEALHAHTVAVREQGEALRSRQDAVAEALSVLRGRIEATKLPTDAVVPVTQALERASASLAEETRRHGEALAALREAAETQARRPDVADNVTPLRTHVGDEKGAA